MVKFIEIDQKFEHTSTNPWNVNRADECWKYRQPEVQSSLFELFEEVFQPKKQIRNKETGGFTVIIADKNHIGQIINAAKILGLSVAPYNGIKYNKGDFILFGHSKSCFDVDFARSGEYIKKNNLIPIYDSNSDCDVVTEAVIAYVKEKEIETVKAGSPKKPSLQMLKGVYKSRPVDNNVNVRKVKTETINVGGFVYPKYITSIIVE